MEGRRECGRGGGKEGEGVVGEEVRVEEWNTHNTLSLSLSLSWQCSSITQFPGYQTHVHMHTRSIHTHTCIHIVYVRTSCLCAFIFKLAPYVHRQVVPSYTCKQAACMHTHIFNAHSAYHIELMRLESTLI